MGLIKHKIRSYNVYIYAFEVMDQRFKNAFKMSAGPVTSAVQIFFTSLR